MPQCSLLSSVLTQALTPSGKQARKGGWHLLFGVKINGRFVPVAEHTISKNSLHKNIKIGKMKFNRKNYEMRINVYNLPSSRYYCKKIVLRKELGFFSMTCYDL
jgi:hypothetical protein